MQAIETAQPGPGEPPDGVGSDAAGEDVVPAAAGAEELAGWLLEGRYLTVDVRGGVTTWSAAAERAFELKRKEVVGAPVADTLIAEGDRPAFAQRLAALLDGDAEAAGAAGEVAVLTGSGAALRARLATVPIHVAIGYELNAVLQEIAARAGARAQRAERHRAVVDLLDGAMSGRHAAEAESEDGQRLAGALIVFDVKAPPAEQTPVDNVVPIADAPSVDDARSRQAAEEVERLEHELQRSRNEADVARQEVQDARDALATAQHQAEAAERSLAQARQEAEAAGAAAEKARIEMEEAARESQRLRSELVETREEARVSVGRIEAELARARETADASAAELAAARTELADLRRDAGRQEGELEATRARAEAIQAELASVRADAGDARGQAERTQLELERLRAELEATEASARAARADADRLAGELGEAQNRLAEPGGAAQPPPELKQRLEAVFDRAPVGAILTAPDGRIVDVNRTLCDTLGHSRAALLGDEPPALVHPDDVDAKRELARRLLRGDQALARSLRRYLHADGYAITMRESAALIRDGDGEPAMFVFQVEEAYGDDGLEEVVDADIALDDHDRGHAGADGNAPSYALVQRAVEDELFVLHCQPVLDLHSNEIAQHELLLRLTASDGRLILPQAFLEPARRAGLSGAIDRWVIRRAFSLLAGSDDVSLEVNLSPEAIHDSELPSVIEEELASTMVDPSRLILEITSDAAVEDLAAAQALAKRLRALGCRFALDDFHSTFGSLRLLKDLPLDYLKLDGDLVSSLPESRTSQLIVRAIVDVASGTGTKTIAVFVADDSVLPHLRQQGVDFAQGYTVARPRPVEDVFPAAAGELPPGAAS